MQDRGWIKDTLTKIDGDYRRSADTHLIPLTLPASIASPDIDIYFKDESTHPSGSLKHRLARSLFLYSICNGWIRQGTTVVEASSGSTAISEAYFARLIGLPFYAVVPRSTAKHKIELIRFYGGDVHFVDHGSQIYEQSRELARQTHGHFMDQFTYAERATDWRGNNNIAESVFVQMEKERFAQPAWIVVGAGTGGTCATFGRYVRYQRLASQIAVVDPENSVFAEYVETGNSALTCERGSRIEGIGRPRVEPSFIREVVDRAIQVSDLDSIAAMRLMSQWIGRRVGPSTGTNLIGVLRLMEQMREENTAGSIVSLICDAGDRYEHLYDDNWVAQHFGDGLNERIARLQKGIFL